MTVSRAPHIEIERPLTRLSLADGHAADGVRTRGYAHPLAPVLMGVSVAVLVALAIVLTRGTGNLAGLWGASGLAVVVWLRTSRGRRNDAMYAAVVAVSILVGELIAGNKPMLSLLFTVTNMIEIGAAVFLARRFAPTLDMFSLNGAVRFLASAALIAPLPAALFYSLVLAQMGPHGVFETIQVWWLGHTLGLAVIGALGLSLTPATMASLRRPRKLIEAGALLVVLFGFFYLSFSGSVKFAFLMMPVLLTIAVRLGVAGTAASVLAVGVMIVGSAIAGKGPYTIGLNPIQQILMAQSLVLVGYVPMVLMAALLEERDRLAARARIGRERAEKASEAKSRLLANVAHEIKSPVAGIIGIGELWSKGGLGAITPSQVEMADMLVKTARQVETLAHDLLDVARAEAGSVKVELRPTDVPGLVEDIRRSALLRPETSGIAIETAIEGEGLVALADSQRLAQVINNLTTNAIKYGAAGGRVVLRVSPVDDCVQVEVIDFGPGITPQKQAQLFEPFNRLGLERSAIEGHGVGLALAKRLIELQGGSIGVISTPGQGATFWIQLPAA